MRTLVLLVCALGCAARQPTTQEPGEKPIPEALRADIARAARLGRALHDSEVVSAKATHAMVTAGHLPSDARIVGLVTRGGTAEFVTGSADAPQVVYSVTVSNQGPPAITVIEPPRALDAEGAAMMRARQQASIAAKQLAGAMCDRDYKVVALPAALAGEEGWLVYLLASAKPDERVLAGHHRAHVSADGRKLLEVTPLSRGCVVGPPSGDEAQVGIMITDFIGPTPLETHVLISLLYRQVVIVAAGKDSWAILGEQIRLYEPR